MVHNVVFGPGSMIGVSPSYESVIRNGYTDMARKR